MDKSYRFLSNIEPSDEQLHALMQAVTQDVKERAVKIEAKHKALMQQQLKETLEQWQLIHVNNGKK
jgi:hypothetical protein